MCEGSDNVRLSLESNLNNCLDVESKCLDLIYEFLDCHGFDETIEAFKRDAIKTGFSVDNLNGCTKERVKRADTLKLFDGLSSSDFTSFFKDWETSIPSGIKTGSSYKKLTIYLYTYFATHSVKNDGKRNELDDSRSVGKYAPIIEQMSQNEDSDSFKTSHPSDQLTRLNGTFVLEKPFQDNIPSIESTPYSRRESRDFELDSLEDANERSNSVLTIDYENTAMFMFKKFLSEHGAEFATEPEFLPYFALPFVENPKDHPTFTKVYETDWLTNLKNNLASFLIEHSCGEAAVPEIVAIYRLHVAAKDPFIVKTFADEGNNLKELKRKMRKLKRDHQKLVGVTGELVNALENSVQGKAVELKSILMKCTSIFPELFPTHLPPHHKRWHSPDGRNHIRKFNLTTSNLDVKRVKQDLSEGSLKGQLLLLQALRWMLTKCTSDERDEAVHWFSKHDIIGVRDGHIKEFLVPTTTPHPIQQAIVRIINALSSLNCGRKYLEQNEATIDLLLDMTKQKELDPVTEDMLIAIFQKLSIRKRWCQKFRENGLIDWILGKLERQPQKIFCLEYSTSLLMNLVLNANSDYWDSKVQIASVLMNLLFSTHRQAFEFVCGTLCCVLQNDSINDYCRTEGLVAKLSTCYNNYMGDPLIEKQIYTLIKIHRREIAPESFIPCIGTYSDEDMDDPEYLDPEIDELDPVTGQPNGIDLLRQQYCLVFNFPRAGRSPVRLQTIPASPIHVLPSWAKFS